MSHEFGLYSFISTYTGMSVVFGVLNVYRIPTSTIERWINMGFGTAVISLYSVGMVEAIR